MTTQPQLIRLISVQSGKRIEFEGNADNAAVSIGGEHIQKRHFELGASPRLVPLDFFRSQRQGQIECGDTLFVKDGATLGKSMFVSEKPYERMLVNEHVFVLRPRTIEPRFLSYLVQSAESQHLIWSSVMAAAQPGIGREFAKAIRVSLTDQRRQSLIADFLDRETARIDELIDKKNRLLELLSERRTALFTLAATRGFDNSVTLMESGSTFFGSVPAGWSVERLRFSLSNIEQGWSPLAENRTVELGEWGVLKVGCVNKGRFRALEHKALAADTEPRPNLEVKNGELLMSRGNTTELVGSAAIVRDIQPKLMLSDLLYRLRMRKGYAMLEFAEIALNSKPLRRQIELCASGASDTMPKISQQKIKNLIWVRPPIEEQEGLASQVSDRLAPMNAAALATEKSVIRLREFRTALITSAVTGQIDISDWAKSRTTARRLGEMTA